MEEKVGGDVAETQKIVFQEVLQSKQRMQASLQASMLSDDSLKMFDDVNNRVISHLASFVQDPVVEENFYLKAVRKVLTQDNKSG